MADFYTEIFPAEDGDITINVYHGTRDDGFRRLMTGGDGDNLIEAGGYFNTLIGGAGADTLTTRFSYVTLEGGEGDDYILVDNSGSTNENISHVVLTGGAGRDTFAFMPGEHTINATLTDFDPAEDSLVLVSLTADGSLAVLNAIDDGGIALKENEWGLAEAAARQSLSPNVDVIEGFVYDSDTRVAELHVTDAKLALNFEGIDNIDELKQIDMLIVDTDGNSLDSRKVQPTLPNGLSIYHSDDYNEDWLYVSSSYIGDVWLGGVDWKGADGLTWSDTTISDIHANNDTVSGRMLAGNANNNYIYAGSGGASMWGGTGGRDILYGGAGADTFIAATSSVEGYTYMRNVGEEDVVRLELFSSTNIFSSGDNIPDVYLEGFSSGDYWNNSQYHWRIDDYDSFLYISDNGSLYGALSVYVNPNSGARTSTIELADGYRLRFDYLTQAWEGYEDNIWTPLALKSGSLELTDINGRNALKVNASYNGNIWLEGSEYFSSTTIIDAADDAVPNRMFVGNGLNNSIVASSRGASLWGAAGNDTLVGGNGADIFYVGQGEGRTTILDAADDDIILLWNIAADDFASLDPNFVMDANGVSLSMNDGSLIKVRRADGATTTTFMLDDYSRWQYSYSDQSWSQTVQRLPEGIERLGNSITVNSSFEGNVVTGGVDWNGATVDGLKDRSITEVDARRDTVEGRLLAGSDQNDEIRAGSGGASLWGGYGGSDYLYGGAGADTFIAGQGEGNAVIYDCDDNDIVVLHNINRSDIVDIHLYEGSYSNQINITTSDGSRIYIWYDPDATTKTTIRYADGETRTFDHVNGTWWDLFSDPSTPNFLNVGSSVYISSAFNEDIALGGVDWNGETVDAWSSTSIVSAVHAEGDTVKGRLLAGDAHSNDIYAGSGGASLWGGSGGLDFLYGGDGADTFIAGSGEDINIYDCSGNDLIYLYNINLDDSPNWSLNSSYTYSSYLEARDPNGTRFSIQHENADTTSKTRVQYAGGEIFAYDYTSRSWQLESAGSNTTLSGDLFKLGSTVYVSSAYVGDVALGGVDWNEESVDAWSDESAATIDASNDTVSGRLLAGNSSINRIYAGSGGALIWGGNGGWDDLYGGAGADTFLAGKNDGATYIYNCVDEDIVYLYDITPDDITDIDSSYMWLSTNDGTAICVIRYNNSASSTTFRFADDDIRTFNYAEDNWREVFTDRSVTLPAGLTKVGSRTAYVSSSYAGDLYLGDVDINGNTVEGLSLSAITSVDASDDTVGGRMLAGDENSNTIKAGAGGVSLWGGNGGNDQLHGGDGADMFIVGEGEGNSTLIDIGDNDTVLFYNIDIDDIARVGIDPLYARDYINVTTTGGTEIAIRYADDATLTSIRYVNGETRTWDHVNGSWYDLFINNDENLPNGLSRAGGNILLSSSYEGDLWLGGVDLDGNSIDGWTSTLLSGIDARQDTVSNRMLAGNEDDNEIYAGSGGASMWGGTGGYDYLYGGAGADTFIACSSDGYSYVYDCGDEDIIVFYNTNPRRVTTSVYKTSVGTYLRMFAVGSTVSAFYDNSDTTSATTVQFATGDVLSFDHDAKYWKVISTGAESTVPDGLVELGTTVLVSSAYVGDVVLCGTDWAGNTVDGWSDNLIANIDARDDTVSGRFLAGGYINSYVSSSVIRAGSGGASLWGGKGGLYHSLYGGAGADTFIVSSSELYSYIYDCGNEDIVLLCNIALENISDVSLQSDSSLQSDPDSEYLHIHSGATHAYINYSTDTTLTTIQFADGKTRTWDHLNGNWSDLFIDNETPPPDGLSRDIRGITVSSDYEGDLWLGGVDLNGETLDGWADSALITIDAANDTVNGRMLAGNARRNYIYAGSGGVSLWGGVGGGDVLDGGAGNDTFIAGQGEGDCYIYNCSDDDIVVLHNINPRNVISTTVDSVSGRISMTTNDETYIAISCDTDTTSTTTIQYATGLRVRYDHASDSWSTISSSIVSSMPVGLVQSNDTVQVSSNYVGNIVFGGVDWNGDSIEGWSNKALPHIDASNDTVGGRLLSGDSSGNRIRAGAGGASLWGGKGGYDHLYGGDGKDTFIAGKGEGYTDIRDCGDDDIVVLHNIMPADIYSATVVGSSDDAYIQLRTNDSTYIFIGWDSGTTKTTFQFADGEQRIYDHATGNLQKVFVEITEVEPGLRSDGTTVTVSSSYVGDVWLSGTDLEGNTVGSWSDTAIENIDASNDTVSGRMLAGNARQNYIYAGSGGVSLWGGNGGYAVLYGGDGADTFIITSNESYVGIYRCGDEDVVALHDIRSSQITYASVGTDSEGDYIQFSIGDDNWYYVYYDSATTRTTLRYQNGETRTFDHSEGNWRDLFIDNDSSLPAGLSKFTNTVYVSSEFEGDINLGGVDLEGNTVDAWSDSSFANIDATNDTVEGRVLVGNSESNVIRAGSGGSSMWGGTGGYNYLYGGAGNDTFIAGDGYYSHVYNYADGDILVLRNIDISDISLVNLYKSDEQNYIQIMTTYSGQVTVYCDSDLTTMTVQYADGTTRTVDDFMSDWQSLFTDNDASLPSGLSKIGRTVCVSSDYVGNVYLGSEDYEGNTVEGMSDTVFANINASQDTSSGRLLVGDAQANYIYAGSGGASLWGGNGGWDDLYGGDGADTFIAGMGEGRTSIHDCSDDDIVVLHNMNIADASSVSVVTWANYIRVTATVSTYIDIYYDSSTTTATTIQYADGTTVRYDHAEGEWSTLQSSASLDELWGGSVDGVDDLIRADVDDDPLASVLNVAGNVALNELNPLSTAVELDGNSLIMKYAADLRRRSNR